MCVEEYSSLLHVMSSNASECVFRIHSETVDFFNGKGAEMFGYCVYGTACCEVEVDCLTGDHHVGDVFL